MSPRRRHSALQGGQEIHVACLSSPTPASPSLGNLLGQLTHSSTVNTVTQERSLIPESALREDLGRSGEPDTFINLKSGMHSVHLMKAPPPTNSTDRCHLFQKQSTGTSGMTQRPTSLSSSCWKMVH